MNNVEYATKMYRLRFNKTDFSSDKEFEEYKKLAHAWWNENHMETEKEYTFRINYINPPSLSALIHIKEPPKFAGDKYLDTELPGTMNGPPGPIGPKGKLGPNGPAGPVGVDITNWDFDDVTMLHQINTLSFSMQTIARKYLCLKYKCDIRSL